MTEQEIMEELDHLINSSSAELANNAWGNIARQASQKAIDSAKKNEIKKKKVSLYDRAKALAVAS